MLCSDVAQEQHALRTLVFKSVQGREGAPPSPAARCQELSGQWDFLVLSSNAAWFTGSFAPPAHGCGLLPFFCLILQSPDASAQP